MKIATYNLEFLFDEGVRKHSGKDYAFSKEFTDERVNYFAKEFSDIDADILFLQELGSESVLQRILKNMNEKYFYFIAEPDQFGVGNAVIYKNKNCVCNSIPAKTDMPVFLEGDEDVIGKSIWSRRDFVHLKASYADKTFNLLGLHIKSNFLMPEKTKDGEYKPMKTQIGVADERIRSEIFRFSQAKKARETVDKFFAEYKDGYVVVLGDFNSKTDNPVYRIIQGEIQKQRDSLVSLIDMIPENKRFSSISNSQKSLIDHMLVSKNLTDKVESIEIQNDLIFDHKEDERFPFIVESDHAPVILKLAESKK